MQVLERERTRIAQELHAGAGQPLAGIKMNLDLLEQSLTQMPLEAQAAMTRLRALADDALEQIRVVSHHLQPPEWQKLTTEAALRTLVRTSGILDRYKATILIALPAAELPHRIKVALYRCTQESIANVIRHSEASSLNLSVTEGHGSIELRVEDNGRGMAQGQPDDPAGIGLRSIRDQAALAGGACQILSDLQGTKVIISLPLTEN
jgi:signal transduction histidine kinase